MYLTNPNAQEAVRARLKAAAVAAVRRALSAVPSTGDVVVFLGVDPHAVDAVLTLVALRQPVPHICQCVNHERLDENTFLRLVGASVSRELLGLIHVATGHTVQR